MPSSLMPEDSSKALHEKLLDLRLDAKRRYKAVNKLSIPEKIKIDAQQDYNNWLEKYFALSVSKRFTALGKNKTPGSGEYITACRQEYMKFVEFYTALEQLIVGHFMPCQHLQGNDYIKQALAKLPEETKTAIKRRRNQ